MCGGFIDSVTGVPTAYINRQTGLPSPEGAKGFICPSPSICLVSRMRHFFESFHSNLSV